MINLRCRRSGSYGRWPAGGTRKRNAPCRSSRFPPTGFRPPVTADLAAMTRPWVSGQHHHLPSGAFVREILGSVVFPLRPLVVGVCELAQEGCGPVPAVGHAFGPCPELRGEVTFLDAAVGRG